ncbi:hypothetical protein [Pseudomonas amygdali]|uniref:Uncharacterized protein n=2 Tax=Pseudomonas amygdali pv. lachrymans TaxID=53707 RepID=A0ABR5KSA3_PSEAV|nr:hypothetical protein [Pseudomonas amygdali]AXH59865.1 hypothetical protein PLA107_032080 [Pseudomonas amygdali pv. lachrymans str. M301315]KPC17279.1 Uncharacterized protein AC499_0481 [Pseudomonas amygdali pv. lachrymans]RMT05701.1 hypothetical protein ALP54_03743 [Pseudomonas amygdali pv. lachrymans]
MNKIETLESAIAYFQQHGVSAIDSYPYEPCDPFYDTMIWGVGACVGVTKAMLPVYVATLLGYSTPLIAKAMLHAEIDIKQVARYVEVNGMDVHVLDDIHKLDPVDFAKKIFEAYSHDHSEQGWYKDDMIEALETQHSLFSLGIMHLAVEGVDFAEVIKRERQYLQNYQPGNPNLQAPDIECRAHHLRDVLYSIELVKHLPNSSPLDFIRQVGGLDPFITRKTFAAGFWEGVIYQDTNSKKSDVYNRLLKSLITDYPKEAAKILKSLDFNTTDMVPDIDSVAGTFEAIEAQMKANGMADIINDISYQIGTITSQVNENDNLTFQDHEGLILGKLGTEVFADRFMAMRDLGPKLYEQVMASHMKIPADEISLSHLQVWSILARFKPEPQEVSPKKAGLYLAHMAAGMRSLLPEGHLHIRYYDNYVLSPVESSIGSLIAKLARKIDYAPLRGLDEDAKEMLSKWGLSLRDLGVKRTKTIEDRMGSDLGL